MCTILQCVCNSRTLRCVCVCVECLDIIRTYAQNVFKEFWEIARSLPLYYIICILYRRTLYMQARLKLSTRILGYKTNKTNIFPS